MGKITNFSLDEYTSDSLDSPHFYPTTSLFIYFTSKFLFKCWPSSFLIHSLGGLSCSYYLTHDLKDHNLNSDISAQTFSVWSRLVNPNIYSIRPLAEILINMSEVELSIYPILSDRCYFLSVFLKIINMWCHSSPRWSIQTNKNARNSQSPRSHHWFLFFFHHLYSIHQQILVVPSTK